MEASMKTLLFLILILTGAFLGHLLKCIRKVCMENQTMTPPDDPLPVGD